MGAALRAEHFLAEIRTTASLRHPHIYSRHRRNAHANWDIAPDGRSFLLIQPLGGGLSTVVAHGWGREFEARVASRGGSARP